MIFLSLFSLFIFFGLGFYFFFPNGWERELALKIRRGESSSWVAEQIREDLLPFSERGITHEMLDKVMACDKGDLYLVRFQIKGNQVEMRLPEGRSPHFVMLKLHQVFRKLAETVPLPDVDFIVSAHDSLSGVDLPGPVFSFAKNKLLDRKLILLPDHEALSRHNLEEIDQGKQRFPWHQKIEKIYWRGATSGQKFSSKDFPALARTKAVALSLQHPEEIDAKFHLVAQCDDPDRLQAVYPEYFGKPTSLKKHLQYKYQLLIDGNSCAFARAYWQLFSETPIFKVDSPNIQWYYRALVPNKHFIPVKADSSDLLQKIEWAKSHDREVRRIGQNAYKFAQDDLQYSAIMYYLYLLLSEYAKLQKS